MQTQMNRRWLLWIVALVVFGIDQVAKYLVRTNIPLHKTIWPFTTPPFDRVGIMYTFNTGAAFGILPDYGTFFVIVAVIVIAGIVFFQHRLPSHRTALFLALGLQLGGALGNLVDRLRYGHVIDFIRVDITSTYTFPIFNTADMAIVTGVFWLAWLLGRETEDEQETVMSPLSDDETRPIFVEFTGRNGHNERYTEDVMAWPSEAEAQEE